MERGLQGSQRGPCRKRGTIEMEMRIRGGLSEKELAKTGVDWKWGLLEGEPVGMGARSVCL